MGRAVAINNKGNWILIGAKDGTTKRYSLKNNKIEHYSTFKHATRWVSDIKFSPDDSKVVVGAHDRNIYGYDIDVTGKKNGWMRWK